MQEMSRVADRSACVRLAEPADIEGINQVRHDLACLLRLWPLTPDELFDEGRTSFVARQSDRIAGYVTVKFPASRNEPDAAEVEQLYVSPAFQRNGSGLKCAENFAKLKTSATRLVLGVSDKLDRAKAMYEKFGFTITRREGPGVFMKKEI
jgi:ribosomal protein S18 acetylase RimI-like enzyme